MAPPPARLAATDHAAPSLRSTLLIVFGLVVSAVAAILLLRCLLRRWAAAPSSSSSQTHGRARRAGGVAVQGVAGVPAESDDDDQADADAGAAAQAGLARRRVASAAAAASTAEEEEEEEEPGDGTDDDTDTERLIASLPLFTTASPLLAALQKNSPDCAVCLSPFEYYAGRAEELRLLPACRHAFHAACIDAWLRTNLVCPICRCTVSSPLPPLPVPAADAAAALGDDHKEPEAAAVAVAKSASSTLSGWWSQGYRRDEPRQWDVEAARQEEENEPWALVALARWIFGLHDC